MRCSAPRRLATLPLVAVLAIVPTAGQAESGGPDDGPVSHTKESADPSEPSGSAAVARADASEAEEEGSESVEREALLSLVGDAAAGAIKAVMCGGCHGPDGNALAPIFPHLAGQRSDYVAKQLRDFKSGRRLDPIMAGMVVALSDQDIVDVAAHFERQQIRRGIGEPGPAARGKRIYREGRPETGVVPCIGCHGPNGEGFNGSIEGGFPALGGPGRDYLMKQLQSFRSGTRTNDWNGIMQLVASRLSDRDMAALTAYLVSLPRTPVQDARDIPPDDAGAAENVLP
jgi:cytochrome c553